MRRFEPIGTKHLSHVAAVEHQLRDLCSLGGSALVIRLERIVEGFLKLEAFDLGG